MDKTLKFQSLPYYTMRNSGPRAVFFPPKSQKRPKRWSQALPLSQIALPVRRFIQTIFVLVAQVKNIRNVAEGINYLSPLEFKGSSMQTKSFGLIIRRAFFVLFGWKKSHCKSSALFLLYEQGRLS